MKKVIILGSTGSIGTQTLKVIEELKDEFKVVGLACGSNLALLEEQILKFQPQKVCVYDEKIVCPNHYLRGIEGLNQLCELDADIVVVAIPSSLAIKPTIKAIQTGKVIALATKEVLVAGGELITELCKKYKTKMIPIDSEHNAIYQCLKGESIESVSRLILTASGGPFLHFSKERLDHITVEQALCHPNWTMGKKVTIDSSTLMNKALELIEAHWLFNMPVDKIEVVVHPQSVIHSMVEFFDGSIIAQASKPSMMIPIHVALCDPVRIKRDFVPFPLTHEHRLEFFPVDHHRFPCLKMGIEALKVGKSAPCYMNKVNELLVELFLQKRINWITISRCLIELIEKHQPVEVDSYQGIVEVEKEAKAALEDLVLVGRL